MKTTLTFFLSCLFCLTLLFLSGCGNSTGTVPEQEWQMPTLPSSVPGVEPLMTRGHLALEESDWRAASGFFDSALNLDAEYAPAYVGKLLAELRVRSEEDLSELNLPISDSRNFQLAVRFADAAYKAKLEGYDKKIKERIQRERIERERREAEAQKRMEQERIERERREAEAKATAERAEQERKERLQQEQEFNRLQMEQANMEQAGERIVLSINGVEYAFRWCPAGTFTMGSPASELGRRDDEEQHQVTLTQGFWLLETEVTQEMWEKVMGNNPSRFKSANLPVAGVSWNNSQEYIKTLNDWGIAPSGFKFSLPTEAQWEHACRAGTTTAYYFGNTLNQDQANFGKENSNPNLKREVGSYPANAWGLQDMHGNVTEWCADWYGIYSSSAGTDPTGASSGSFRVIRGGSWIFNAENCRSARRIGVPPSNPNPSFGLRLSLVRAE